MEIESEIECKDKGSGFWGHPIKHSLCARGYKFKSGDAKMAKLRVLSEEDDLTWKKFKEIVGDDAEEKLAQMIDDGAIELDAEELEEGQRPWKSQTILEIEDEDGETKEVVVDNKTHLTLLK